MGAPLGYFSEDTQNDFPELNKCPDCETFFQSLTCPLCGKVCPEEMRAGNRKPVKQKKSRRSNGSGRVTFEPWYHNLWFIIVMLLVVPLVGLILLWQSSRSKGWKIGLSLVVAAPYILSAVLTVIGFFAGWFGSSKAPFSDVPPIEEYAEICVQADAEAYYRSPATYAGQDIMLELTVVSKQRVETADVYDYADYYECKTEVNGKELRFWIWDCRAESGAINLAPGDRITVYGTAVGFESVRVQGAGSAKYPCMEAYYIVLQN